MSDYIPTTVVFASCGNLKDSDGNEYPVVKPFCSKFNPPRHRKTLFSTTQVEYNSFRVVRTDGRSVRAVVDTENGPVMLHRNVLCSGRIANLMILYGFNDEHVVNVNLGFISKINGSTLHFVDRTSEKWVSLIGTGQIREKNLKSSELKIGNVYGQLLKGRPNALLYLGRVRDPTRENKLSYCFIATNWGLIPELDGTAFKGEMQKAFTNFFKFEEEDAPMWRPSSSFAFHIKASVPSNLLFDHGSFDLSCIGTESGNDLAADTLEKRMQASIDKQWMLYRESIEYRKLQGSYQKKYGVRKLIWKPPNPPSWIPWKNRAR